MALLQRARRLQDGDDGAQTELVVGLGGQQPVAELHHARQLLAQDLGLPETLRLQDGLGDEREVRVGHRHGPEEHLHVVGNVPTLVFLRIDIYEVIFIRFETCLS